MIFVGGKYFFKSIGLLAKDYVAVLFVSSLRRIEGGKCRASWISTSIKYFKIRFVSFPLVKQLTSREKKREILATVGTETSPRKDSGSTSLSIKKKSQTNDSPSRKI